MTKIIIQELERDDSPINDIWATIQFKSEKENLDVQFQLELLLQDWDIDKLQSYIYLNGLLRWEKIAKLNNFEFEIASNISIKDAPITL